MLSSSGGVRGSTDYKCRVPGNRVGMVYARVDERVEFEFKVEKDRAADFTGVRRREDTGREGSGDQRGGGGVVIVVDGRRLAAARVNRAKASDDDCSGSSSSAVFKINVGHRVRVTRLRRDG